MTRPIWVVATTATAARWAEAFRDAGLDALALGWGEIEARPADLTLAEALTAGRPDAILLTSANAVRHRPPGTPRDVPAACVGRATARAAEAAGLEVAWVGEGTGADLAEALVRREDVRRLLFLRGAEVAPGAVEALRAAGRWVEEVVVYAARPDAGFAGAVGGAAEPAALAVASPRGAVALDDALVSTGRQGLRATPAAAVGASTAEALRVRGFERVRSADPPGLDGLLGAVRDLLREDPSR